MGSFSSFLLFILSSSSSTRAARCKNKPFPVVFGGSDGDTDLTCFVINGDNVLGMGTTDSDIVYGGVASASPLVVKFNIESGYVDSVGKFTAVTYSSIQNCGGDYQNDAVFFTSSPMQLIYTKDFGTSWTGYQLEDNSGNPLTMTVQDFQLEMENGSYRVHFAAYYGAQLVIARLNIHNRNYLTTVFNIIDGNLSNMLLMASQPTSTDTLGSIRFDYTGGNYQYFFYRHRTTNDFEWIVKSAITAEEIEWIELYNGGSISDNNLIVGSTPDKKVVKVYYWKHGSSTSTAPSYWNEATFTMSSDTYDVKWADVYIQNGDVILRWSGWKSKTAFCYNDIQENKTDKSTHCFEGYTDPSSTILPMWNQNWHHTTLAGTSQFTAALITKKVHQKTYAHNIVQIVNAREGTACKADTTEVFDIPGTLVWNTPSFSSGSSAINLDSHNIVKRRVSNNVGHSAITNNSDIEDPCDINLKLTLTGSSQDVFEYYTGSFDAATCELDNSFCDGKPVMTAAPPNGCVSFQDASPQFSYNSCSGTDSTLDLSTTITCTLANNGDPVSAIPAVVQTITLIDNELILQDCKDQSVEIHDTTTFTFYLDYKGDNSEDFSDVDYTITYDGAPKPSYVTEVQTDGSMQVTIAPRDCKVYSDNDDANLFMQVSAFDDKFDQTVSCQFSVFLVDKSAAPTLADTPFKDKVQEYEVQQPELRLEFPDGSDADSVDEITLTKHFSVDSVEGTFPFIFLKLDPDGDGKDYLVIQTDDNTHSAVDVNDQSSYNREYSIEYWVSDPSNCKVDTASQTSTKQKFTLKITPFNHEPVITGVLGDMHATVFDSGQDGLEFPLPAYQDDDSPLDDLTPYFRYPSSGNQTDLNSDYWQGTEADIPDCELEFLKVESGKIKFHPCWNGMRVFFNYPLQFCVKDNNFVGQLDGSNNSWVKYSCIDFKVSIIPLNHAPTWIGEFEDQHQFNRLDHLYELPKCVDSDEGDTLSASYNHTSLQFGFEDNQPGYQREINPENGQFNLLFEPDAIIYVDEYQICITCTDDNIEGQIDPTDPTADVRKSVSACFIHIIEGVNNPPFWSDDLEDQEIEVGETLTYMMPRYDDIDVLDIFKEEISIKGLDVIPAFMIFSSNNDGTGLKLDLNPDLIEYAGEYTIEILITDSDSEKSGFEEELKGTFRVTVTCKGCEVKEESSFVFDWPITSKKAPEPEIIDISRDGLVHIKWTQKIWTQGNLKYQIEAGAITFFIKSDYPDVENSLVGFSVVEIDESNIFIQLNLTEPDLIDSRPDQDDYLIAAFEQSIFTGKDSNLKNEADITLEFEIPRQVSSDALAALEDGKAAIVGFVQTLFAGNYILSLVASASMNMLWSLLNTLQIIVSLPLLNLVFPFHTEFISGILNDVANIKVLKVNSMNMVILDFSKSIKILPSHHRFREYSHESTNFILNSEILFWVLVIYAMLCYPVYLGYYRSDCRRARIFFRFMYSKMFFNFIIRFLLESFMDLYLNALVNIFELFSGDFNTFNQYFQDSGGIISTILSIFFLIFYTALPLMLHYWIRSKSYKFEWSSFKNRYGDLYEDFNLQKKQAHLFYYYFILRRMVYCLCYYFMKDFLFLQLTFLNIGSFFMLAFLLSVKPYERDFLNKIELFNESIILFLTYFCWTFSDYQPDLEIKDEWGWYYINIMLLIIFANVIFMLYDGCLKPCLQRGKKKPQNKKKSRLSQRLKTGTSCTMEGLMDKSYGLSAFGQSDKSQILQKSKKKVFLNKAGAYQYKQKAPRNELKEKIDLSLNRYVVTKTKQEPVGTSYFQRRFMKDQPQNSPTRAQSPEVSQFNQSVAKRKSIFKNKANSIVEVKSVQSKKSTKMKNNYMQDNSSEKAQTSLFMKKMMKAGLQQSDVNME